jgi:hypothetical protein
MPQLTLSDGDLLKKTLRTTLVMLGTTALWLGGLTGVVVMTTGPASGSAESKAEKAAPAGSAGSKSPVVVPAAKVHRTGARAGDPAHAGDPI